MNAYPSMRVFKVTLTLRHQASNPNFLDVHGIDGAANKNAIGICETGKELQLTRMLACSKFGVSGDSGLRNYLSAGSSGSGLKTVAGATSSDEKQLADF